MTSSVPDWIANVPLKTVGVLCAVNIFGKNIESRQITLAGKRYLHNAVENVVNYALNPILPNFRILGGGVDATAQNAEAAEALRNVRDCFQYIFRIQVEYFKLLNRIKPGHFRSRRTGREFNLNQFAAKSPTLINSEKRYLILSRIDGAQPYDLNLDWNADFDWIDAGVKTRFKERLLWAQEAYADTLQLSEWYDGREKNLIIPLKTILDDLGEYFVHLGQAAYFMAVKKKGDLAHARAAIRRNLLAAGDHLVRFSLDMARINVFSVIKNDMDRLDETQIDAVIKARALDESRGGQDEDGQLLERYVDILSKFYETLGFELGFNRLQSLRATV